jgi:hypothetical protein
MGASTWKDFVFPSIKGTLEGICWAPLGGAKPYIPPIQTWHPDIDWSMPPIDPISMRPAPKKIQDPDVCLSRDLESTLRLVPPKREKTNGRNERCKRTFFPDEIERRAQKPRKSR